jgi:dipeptidyl aminopeptidase/acylaminoacyl peptidase
MKTAWSTSSSWTHDPSKGKRLSIPYSTFGSLQSDGNDTLFVVGASASQASEVASFKLTANKHEVLKRSLDISLDEGYLSIPEPIEFPTSKNRTAFAFFYKPKNKDFASPAVCCRRWS